METLTFNLISLIIFVYLIEIIITLPCTTDNIGKKYDECFMNKRNSKYKIN